MTCGMILFPGMTQLDVTGPYEVLCGVPELRVLLLSLDGKPIRSEHGMMLTPDCSFAHAPPLDILVAPGGPGVNETLLDKRYLDFIRDAESRASWITSICTGSLLLGAAGLLRGYRATTHWASIEFLSAFGAIPVATERVVIDRNRITGAGVSAGIDFALVLAAKIADERTAQEIQLAIEYDPAPPFRGGHPRKASADILATVQERFKKHMERRKAAVISAAEALRNDHGNSR